MSWNPFSRLSGSKRPVISQSAERQFEKEVKNLYHLEENTKRLYKDGKRLVDANSSLMKAERRLTQELLGTVLGQSEPGIKWQLDEWDKTLSILDTHNHDLNAVIQKTIIAPVKKFSTLFPNFNTAVRRREQALQELQKCHSKFSKYQQRDRTGHNIVKLDAGKRALVQAQNDFNSQSATLLEDMPKLSECRMLFFQPSLETLIKAQFRYLTDSFKLYGELSSMLGDEKHASGEGCSATIQRELAEIRALSITVD